MQTMIAVCLFPGRVDGVVDLLEALRQELAKIGAKMEILNPKLPSVGGRGLLVEVEAEAFTEPQVVADILRTVGLSLCSETPISTEPSTSDGLFFIPFFVYLYLVALLMLVFTYKVGQCQPDRQSRVTAADGLFFY